MSQRNLNVLVVGGAGYVGAVLVPQLLAKGHKVTVLDLFMYGEDLFKDLRSNPNYREIKGDMRDLPTVEKALEGCNAVIHLACISNDPSFELNPELGKSINYDSFRPLVQAAKRAGVERFVYASSSSVYGIKEGIVVTEDVSLEPLTDYSKFKAMCEVVLEEERAPGFTTLVVRPATVCGYSPRQRLDVIVNILTNHAVNLNKVTVLGGKQLRPNIHIQDMCNFYLNSLEWPAEKIDGKVYNVGDVNYSVTELAEMVRKVVGEQVALEVKPTNDNRSYHVSSDAIAKDLGFRPTNGIEKAVRDLLVAFKEGKLPNSLDDIRYYNIKTMQALNLK